MLNKDNYVPWSFRLLHYAKSKPNEKSLVNLIKNHPYVRRMIHEPGDPNNIPPVAESTHEQTDDELTEKEAKQMESLGFKIFHYIYAAGFKNHPPMLNKDNYVPWSSRLLRYVKSKPNRKLLVNSIKNGLYVRRMIHEPGDPNSIPPVAESTHEQTNDKLTEKDANCDTTQEIWLRVQQLIKGSDIGLHENEAKLFNEWENFKSTEGELIESYYHHFAKLMNDFK
ncbi:hypothetical protein Tco_0517504 [Tanacetum coccineum]